jgi:AcrR family transcriptional regulator
VEPNGRSYRGLSPQRREAERVARFVDAGLEIFGTQGFHAATVDSVCAAAGLTKRYFYQGFGSMEALFHAVYRRCAESFMRMAVSAVNDPSSDALACLNQFFDEIESDPRVGRVLLIEVFDISPTTYQLWRTTMSAFEELTAKSIGDHAVEGVDTNLIAHGLIGAMHYIAREWLESGYAKPRAEVALSCNALFAAVHTHFGSPT